GSASPRLQTPPFSTAHVSKRTAEAPTTHRLTTHRGLAEQDFHTPPPTRARGERAAQPRLASPTTPPAPLNPYDSPTTTSQRASATRQRNAPAQRASAT